MLSLIPIYLSIAKFQYLILFPIVAIEGPIVSVIVGFLIAHNLMNFYIASLVIICGDLAGDSLYYALGRWGRDFGLKLFRISEKKIHNLEHHFIKHGGKTILLGKLAHGIGTTFLFAAGTAKMPFGKYLYYNILGTIPKSLILILVGYLFGQSFVRINKYFDYYAIFTLSLGMILIIAYLIIIKKIRKKELL